MFLPHAFTPNVAARFGFAPLCPIAMMRIQPRSVKTMRAIPISILAVLAAAAAALAGPVSAKSDAELIAACASEAEERLYSGQSGGQPGHHAAVVAAAVTRGEPDDLVRVTVASGEGRSASVTCKFRGNRLFDVYN
jgi:hypothetical protein